MTDFKYICDKKEKIQEHCLTVRMKFELIHQLKRIADGLRK